ncbi:MAG TPA: hypothetical protein VHJ19_03025 [Gammaproteobacteria bacterium]|nr:hypothetical protein [Gammaproteobacteria bacterium]
MSDNTDYRHTATAGGNKPTGKKDKSQATRLIELAAQAKLFHDQEDRGYATIFVAGHKETWPVKSKGFKEWICQELYAYEKRGVNGSALQDAIETVEGQARFDAPEKSAHLRLAEHDGKIYIDLCDPSWRAIEITAHGWQVI